jgi:ketosteroid isomerase-like protein
VATYRVHGRGRGSGAEVDQRLTMIWLVREGKIARVRVYRERAEALEVAGQEE